MRSRYGTKNIYLILLIFWRVKHAYESTLMISYESNLLLFELIGLKLTINKLSKIGVEQFLRYLGKANIWDCIPLAFAHQIESRRRRFSETYWKKFAQWISSIESSTASTVFYFDVL